MNLQDVFMKKIILIVCIAVALMLLIPFPSRQKDGGTVHYNAIIYDVYDVHRINPIDEDCDGTCQTEYIEGTIIKIFGIEIYNNTKSESSPEENINGEENTQAPYFFGIIIEILQNR